MTKTIIQYRREVLSQFFSYIKSGESFYVFGEPGSGKTSLIDYILGEPNDLPDHNRLKFEYLGESASRSLLVRVDMNRLKSDYGWGFGFYELLLNALLNSFNRHEQTGDVEKIQRELAGLVSQVVESRDAFTAHRLFEMAVNSICQEYSIQVCFLFDEFDRDYQAMPPEIYSQMRAIRDANKYFISYALFLRNNPEILRGPFENQDFYELFSNNKMELGPFFVRDFAFDEAQPPVTRLAGDETTDAPPPDGNVKKKKRKGK